MTAAEIRDLEVELLDDVHELASDLRSSSGHAAEGSSVFTKQEAVIGEKR